jgi:anti-anti-sigma factor
MSYRELRMESRLEAMRDVVTLVEQFGADNALPQAVLNDVNVALDEALSNIIAHGYEAASVGEIIVRLDYVRDEVQVEVEDGGRAFDPLQVPAPDLTAPLRERKVGGLGVHLMRNLMDGLAYHRSGGKNHLRMIRKVPVQTSRERDMEAGVTSNEVAVVEPRGRIDSVAAPALTDQIDRLIRAGSRNLLIDLRDIAYVSSAGFRALLVARKLVDETGGKVILCGMSRELRRLFEIGHFTELFVICATRDEGIARAR